MANHGDDKPTPAQRLLELEYCLLERPRNLTELVRRLGVHRTTIWRRMEALRDMGIPIQRDEGKRYWIDRSIYLTNLRLSRHESIAVMLALRLLSQHTHRPDPHIQSSLTKLGIALQKGVAPSVGSHILAMNHSHPVSNDLYGRILERVSDAWIDQRKIELRYRPLRSKRAFDEIFHPYLIEPLAIGHSTYVIGYSELAGALRTRKVERIQRLPVLQDETFNVLEAFDAHRLLASAWGIWFDRDEQPVEVTLHFAAAVARRIRETRWHPTEQLESRPDGGISWRAQVDDWHEMLPWIQGWGSNCEAIAPAELREIQQDEVRRMSQRYGLKLPKSPTVSPDDDFLDAIFGAKGDG